MRLKILFILFLVVSVFAYDPNIDVGSDGGNRASNTTSGTTYLDLTNPVNTNGVIDSLDAYPDDPTKWKSATSNRKDTESWFMWIGLAIIIIILILVPVFFIVRKKFRM